MTSSLWAPTVEVADTQLREDLASFATGDVGAGLVGHDRTLNYPDNTVGKTLQLLDQAITQSLLEGYASITSYGAVGDGIADDTQAFISALAASKQIFIPEAPVCWRISTPITITSNNVKIVGESRFGSIVRAFNASLPVFVINPGVTGVEINNINIDRSVAASSTGFGIDCSSASADILFTNLIVSNQWHGLNLGDTERSRVSQCQLSNNYGNGIQITTGSSGIVGWNVSNSRARYNNGHGISINGSGSATVSRLGEFDSLVADYNAGYGLSVVGAPTKVLESLKIIGGTYSYNNAGGIFIDAYGGRNRISGVNAALSGTATCGRQAGPVVASGQGDGIQLAANTLDVNISGCVCNENSHSGIAALNLFANLASNACNNNGKNVAAASNLRSGIRLSAGQFVAGGNTCTNTGASATQVQGIHITGGTNSVLTANNVAGNINAVGITVVTPSNSNRITNNPGYNPQPADAITIGASPWTYTAGNTPETVYWRGGTVSAVAIDGITIQTASAGATFPATLELGPNESVVFTYTVAPTQFTRKRH